MPEPLKNLYSEAFFDELCRFLRPYLPHLDPDRFKARVFAPDSSAMEWEEMALKQRMRHTTLVLHEFMPANFPEAAEILAAVSRDLPGGTNMSEALPYIVLGDYLEVYGLEHFEESFQAMEAITQFMTCEFAVRPFLLRYPEAAIARMTAFAGHGSHHVRRFASEGTRPRLPWGAAIPFLKKDPAPILPILNQLYRDPHEWVRLSVANSLNDICKDNPEIALSLARQWSGHSKEADKVIRHGLRTLLKQGDTRALALIGLGGAEGLEVRDFRIGTPVVKLGENAEFSFSLVNTTDQPQRFRLEYGVDYQKSNGSLSRKVFKISEGEIGAGEEKVVQRKQHFRPITTRVYHAGSHRIAVIVNGEEVAIGEMTLE